MKQRGSFQAIDLDPALAAGRSDARNHTNRLKGCQMYKKLVFALLVAVLAAQFAVPTVLAAEEPAGSCPPGFMLEEVMPHNEHHHQHVGTSADQNGDGFVCMKHVTLDGSIHVHVDNRLP